MARDSIKDVAILGSCVSRDLIRIATHDTISVKPYIARMTVRSAMSQKTNVHLSRNSSASSNFELRNFFIDCEKSVFDRLSASDPNFCIIDMIDERLGTWRNGDCILAASKGLKNAFDPMPKHWKYATAAATRKETLLLAPAWAAHLRRAMGSKLIIIHRALWAWDNCESKQTLLDNNNFLNKLYDVLIDNIPISVVVKANPSFHLAAKEHKWGVAPFHYIDDYYIDVWQQILRAWNEHAAKRGP